MKNINTQILDDYTNNIKKEWTSESRWYKKLFYKSKKYFKKILILFIIALIGWGIYFFIFAPPRYSKAETKINGERYLELIQDTGVLKSRFEGSLEVLKKYPRFYAKVVNNIDKIEIRNDKCPAACANYCVKDNQIKDLNNIEMEGVLYVNPDRYQDIDKKYETYDSYVGFAGLLVHEADHIEYLKSSKLRKYASLLKCSPFFNPEISFESNIDSLKHRFTTIEICAIREQLQFHKESGTKSGLENDKELHEDFIIFNK